MPMMRRACWFALVGALSGCRCGDDGVGPGPEDAAPPWDVGPITEPRRIGMRWIEPGVLLAGTPPGQLPRVADEELAGVEVELDGFFIDEYSYPGEPGAIPLTNVTQDEARGLCDKQGKRLCTELEWERACKGPRNLTYDYGNEYDETVCATGGSASLAPNAVNTRCESGYGVHDMHGGAWNWTSSDWGRGSTGGKVAVRGGNGLDGELIGRCANGRGYKPTHRDPRIGVRCCAGETNPQLVELAVERGIALHWRAPDPKTAALLEGLVPSEITDQVAGRSAAEQFRVGRLWVWRPIGNEELLIGGGCAHPPRRDACGVVVARVTSTGADRIDFVSSDWWQPTIGEHGAERSLFLYGGDRNGAFRKRVVYEWGRISEGGKWRKKSGGWLRPR